MNSKRCVESGDLGPGFDNDHGGDDNINDSINGDKDQEWI